MAYESYRWVQSHQITSKSSIYSPGSEFLLCQAQVQIMGAVIGVLTESVTESIRGFYKLRKAYITLDVLLTEEDKYLSNLGREGVTLATVKPLRTDSLTDASAEQSR